NASTAAAANAVPNAMPGAPNGRGPNAPPAAPRRFELRELATGKTRAWQEMRLALFSPRSSYLVLQRRALGDTARGAGAAGGGDPSAPNPGGPPPGVPNAPGGGGGGGRGGRAAASTPRGTDVVLVDLASGHTQ